MSSTTEDTEIDDAGDVITTITESDGTVITVETDTTGYSIITIDEVDED